MVNFIKACQVVHKSAIFLSNTPGTYQGGNFLLHFVHFLKKALKIQQKFEEGTKGRENGDET